MRMNTALRMFGFFLLLLVVAAKSQAQIAVGVGISVGFAPPALPVYEQPICPAEGYVWTPGYWAWDSDEGDYYWVPGTWVLAPRVGFFWTPAWWGWEGGHYFFHGGYWGPVVGFYGGINYGFGYFGHGYEGGRWDGGHFFYNRTVNNVNVNVIHNTYNTTIINNNTTINRVSYNGGQGGIQARATAQEEAAVRGEHIGPVAAQEQHVQQARTNRELRASANQGKPPIAATARPANFSEHVPAREAGGRYEPPANRGGAAPGGEAKVPTHVNELPQHQHMTAPNTGNPKIDQKYQQQQDKLYAKQEQQRQQLQQQQEREHQQQQQRQQQMQQRQASQQRQQQAQQRQQQMEQRHQQQTQQLQQQHTQQVQHLQERQSGGGGGARPPHH